MDNVINHLAIIPDGNRRWAKINNINLVDAYIYSCDQIFSYCEQILYKIESLTELSLFFVSNENLKVRTRDDLNALFVAGNYFIEKYVSRINDYNIELKWIGIDHNNPDEVNSDYYIDFLKNIKACPKVLNPTKSLNILIGYDVIKDINNAIVGKSSFNPKDLEVKTDVDLIIRTGGYKRLSGFLPLNCVYSEYVFVDKFFPDLNLDDIFQAIDKFKSVTKNFGK
jgi:undecaprenyl pyrophosphate synthase